MCGYKKWNNSISKYSRREFLWFTPSSSSPTECTDENHKAYVRFLYCLRDKISVRLYYIINSRNFEHFTSLQPTLCIVNRTAYSLQRVYKVQRYFQKKYVSQTLSLRILAARYIHSVWKCRAYFLLIWQFSLTADGLSRYGRKTEERRSGKGCV